MCELMTIGAALVFTALYFTCAKTKAVFTTMLMFWGAALMWSVDCVHAFREGEGLLDLSADDAALGGVILVCAALLYAVLRVREAAAGR